LFFKKKTIKKRLKPNEFGKKWVTFIFSGPYKKSNTSLQQERIQVTVEQNVPFHV
jgi:hypothetical protein